MTVTISLRFVIFAVIALVTVVSALVAFVPMYDASLRGVRSSLEDLRRAYVARVQNQTESFLEAPTTILETLLTGASRGLITFDIEVPAERARWLAWLYDTTTKYSRLMSTVSITVPLVPNPQYNQTAYIVCNTELAALSPALAVVAGLVNVSDQTLYFRTMDRNGSLTDVDPAGGSVVNVTEAIMRGTGLRLIRENPSATTQWFPVEAGFAGPQLTLMGLVRGPTGALLAAVQLVVLPNNFQRFLASLGLRSQGRAFAVDSESSVVIGISTAEPVAELLGLAFLDRSTPDWERMRLKTPANVTDPLIREVVATLGESAILKTPTPFGRILSTQHGRTYLDILETAGSGLQLRTVLIMPEVDFLDDVLKAQNKTLGGVSGAIVAMLLLAFALGHALTSPFAQLRDRMYLTASLQDDSTEVAPSILTEVRGMQKSYSMMRSELAKVKSYLPQSVLTAIQRASLSADEDEPSLEEAYEDDSTRTAAMQVVREDVGVGQLPPDAEKVASVPVEESFEGPHSNSLLNTSAGLTHRRVTVVCFNLRGFNNYVLASSAAEIAAAESRLVECISQRVSEHRGVIDLFHGDRMQASFNAVTPCVGHSKRGALAALAVCRDLSVHKDNAVAFQATAGLSTGLCHAGNVGSSTLKRFCVLGPVVPQAAALERMARLFSATLLCPSTMFQDLNLEFLLRYAAIVHLPGLSRPRIIGAIEGLKRLEGEEWMYQLKDGENADPFATPNQFFSAMAEGNFAAATEVLTKLQSRREEPAVSLMINQATDMLQNCQPEGDHSNTPPTSDTSAYYMRCVARVDASAPRGAPRVGPVLRRQLSSLR